MKKVFDKVGSLELSNIFDFLSTQIPDVIWICSSDYQTQLYISQQFEATWGISREVIYDHREVFPTTILQEDLTRLMPDFIARQQGKCNTPLGYRVRKPNGEISFLKDISYGISDEAGKLCAIFGLAKPINEQEWEELKNKPKNLDLVLTPLEKGLKDIVDRNLDLNFHRNVDTKPKTIKNNFQVLVQNTTIALTKREAECLYYLFKGMSFKDIAKILNVSPRTVETHVINLKMKVNCKRVIDLISKVDNRRQIDDWLF